MQNPTKGLVWLALLVSLTTTQRASGINVETTRLTPDDGNKYHFEGFVSDQMILSFGTAGRSYNRTWITLGADGPVELFAGFNADNVRVVFNGWQPNALLVSAEDSTDPYKEYLLAYNGTTTQRVWSGGLSEHASISYTFGWEDRVVMCEARSSDGVIYRGSLILLDLITGDARTVYQAEPGTSVYPLRLGDGDWFSFSTIDDANTNISWWYDGTRAWQAGGPVPEGYDSWHRWIGNELFVTHSKPDESILYKADGSTLHEITRVNGPGSSVHIHATTDGDATLITKYRNSDGTFEIDRYDAGQVLPLFEVEPGVHFQQSAETLHHSNTAFYEHRPDGPGKIYRIVNGQAQLVHELPADAGGIYFQDVTDERIVYQEWIGDPEEGLSRLIQIDTQGRTDLSPYTDNALPKWFSVVDTPGDALIVSTGEKTDFQSRFVDRGRYDLFLINNGQTIHLDELYDTEDYAPYLHEAHDENGRTVLVWELFEFFVDGEEGDDYYAPTSRYFLYLDGQTIEFEGEFGQLDPGRLIYTQDGMVYSLTWAPIPAPGTLWLATLGGLAMVIRRGRGRT